MIDGTRIEEGVLNVLLKGPFEQEKAPVYFRKLLDTLKAAGLNKVLLDGRGFEGEISIMERYSLGTMFSDFSPLSIRIAIVGSDRLVWPDRFVENVATNRGVAVKVTTDIAEALTWLHAGSETGGKRR